MCNMQHTTCNKQRAMCNVQQTACHGRSGGPDDLVVHQPLAERLALQRPFDRLFVAEARRAASAVGDDGALVVEVEHRQHEALLCFHRSAPCDVLR
jgi:hypothetical protein